MLTVSGCIVFAVCYYIVVRRKESALGQVRFLKSLSGEFSQNHERFRESWGVLSQYKDVPEEMDSGEWQKVVAALTNCYRSARFLAIIARLVRENLISPELLYLFYYDEIIDNWTSKLQFLIQWCGTGLDLAANYDSYELTRMASAIRELVVTLNHIHQKRGRQPDGDAIILAHFDNTAKDLFANPAKYDVSSNNYGGNYVSVRGW
jgi:sulfatase maturation enzyme AslB (radical SAM superfamily)